MYSASLVAVAVALVSTQSVSAWFRLPCSSAPLVTDRVDPVVSPGITPSNHVHTIHGASGFEASSTYDSLRASDCTSCLVSQDLSNYWFPKLYFHDRAKNTFEAVNNGKLLVYYQNRGTQEAQNGGPGLVAFPPGLKMVSGNPFRRSTKYSMDDPSQAALDERAQFYSCLRNGAPGYDSYGKFPTTNCENGLNARIHFPACWDGVNVDSPNHKDHVAYLSSIDNGECPDSHPIGMMKIFYEVTWDINDFADRWTEEEGWPFVHATGDPTGYAWHGDFQNGWDTEVLQKAIDECNNPNDDTWYGIVDACKHFEIQKVSTADQCRIDSVNNEELGGPGVVLDRLPGCNPIQAGPQDATPYNDSNCPF